MFAAVLGLDDDLEGIDQAGTPGIDWALGVVVGPDDGPIVSGMTEGSLAGPFQGGVADVFLARLHP